MKAILQNGKCKLQGDECHSERSEESRPFALLRVTVHAVILYFAIYILQLALEER
jgi:hypothetical protein